MQTSSIMLDSSLGKILAADEVNKSLDTKNSDSNETTTPKTTTSNLDVDINSTGSSEAEVRLVFKFTVEEQLVYKGKIQKVKQLQSEELSRLVSKIAWDSAKEAENNETLKEDNVIESNDSNLQEKRHHKSLSTQTNETSFLSKNLPIEDNSRKPTEHSSEEPTIQIEKTTTCNNQSSDHEAYLKYDSVTPKQNPDDCSFAKLEESHTLISKTKIHCDTFRSEHFSNHIHEKTSQRQSSLSEKQRQQQQQNPLMSKVFRFDDNDHSRKNTVTPSHKEIEAKRILDDATDRQSIADAIEECVNSVDLEFTRQMDHDISLKNISTFDLSSDQVIMENIEDISSYDEQMIEITLEHNSPEDSKININNCRFDVNVINKIDGTSTKPDYHGYKTNHKIENINLEKKSYNEKDVNTIEKIGRKNDLNKQAKNVTQHYKHDSTKNSTPVSGRRKNTSENSTNKRIRKSTSKDQRNLITRKSTNKAIVNISTEQNDSISPTITDNSSNYFQIQSNSNEQDQQQQQQQQVRHTNKIFAKWTDNHYYPGTILRQAKDRKFVIGFLDGAQRNVAEVDLIPLCNIEGRQVRVSIAKNYCVNALVHDQSSSVNDQPMFDVEYQQDGIVRKSVPFKDIFLTGDQGSLLINQVDRNSGASNFADVDLDNIIYEKRSRRLQDMEDYELTENTSVTTKRKRGQHNMRNSRASKTNTTTTTTTTLGSSTSPESLSSPAPVQTKRNSHSDNMNHDSESTGSPDVLKTNFICPNSNPPSESSSSTGSSNVPNVLELGQEFYFASSSPHRTKTSLLL